jgi:hypothetical protein
VNSIRLPFFRELKHAEHVLIAGAGGGFDVFCGLPLYFNLQAAGKRVSLANLSFSNLPPATAGRHLTPELVEVTADSVGSPHYFPEKHLCQWFREHGRDVPVYAIHRTGPALIAKAYEALLEEMRMDTIVLVDGGTDSLMRGDEAGLGTPVEDMSSIAAVDALDPARVPRKMLACLGFGIDAFHGVSHVHVLEAIAELTRAGGYLGAFSLTTDMPEVEKFREATEYVLRQTPRRESIVCTSVLSAIEGRFGDHHRTERTWGSELFINPLMSLYWCFRLDRVASRVLYLDEFRKISGFMHAESFIAEFQAALGNGIRRGGRLPL